MRKLLILLCLVSPSIFLLTQCQPSSSSGEILYQTHCSNCHMEDGKGVGELYPDLNKSAYIQGASLDIACFIRNGILAKNNATARFEEYNMPPNEILSDVDIANILNYLQKEFGQKSTYNFNHVKEKLKGCN